MTPDQGQNTMDIKICKHHSDCANYAMGRYVCFDGGIDCDVFSRKKPKGDKEWINLYHAVNRMMMVVCSEGQVNAKQEVTEDVLEALSWIDDGVYLMDMGAK